MNSHVHKNEQGTRAHRRSAQRSDQSGHGQDDGKNFRYSLPAGVIQPGTTTLIATSDLIVRLGQTVKWQLLADYRDSHVALRSKDKNAFDNEMRLAVAATLVIRDQMRRAEIQPAVDALIKLEQRLQFRVIVESNADLESLVVEVHRSRLQALQDWINVLDGLQTIDNALPPESNLLPLSSIWGHTAKDCFDAWKARRKRDCAKTNDKYASIARALSTVLGGVCVEYRRLSS